VLASWEKVSSRVYFLLYDRGKGEGLRRGYTLKKRKKGKGKGLLLARGRKGVSGVAMLFLEVRAGKKKKGRGPGLRGIKDQESCRRPRGPLKEKKSLLRFETAAGKKTRALRAEGSQEQERPGTTFICGENRARATPLYPAAGRKGPLS